MSEPGAARTEPDRLHVAVRRGVDLDDLAWVERLIADLHRLGAKLLVLDAARRLSAKTDEGPTKVREFVAVLRRIIVATGVTIVIVHHDINPPQTGQDQRRRSQRASGGDWFAACERPVHIEKIGARESLVFPEDYKFIGDPAPFTFSCETAGGLITRLVGLDTTTEHAERAGIRGKVLDWLRANGPASRTAMQKAGLARWETLEHVLEALLKEGKIDAAPGRQKNSLRYFIVGPPGLCWRTRPVSRQVRFINSRAESYRRSGKDSESYSPPLLRGVGLPVGLLRLEDV